MDLQAVFNIVEICVRQGVQDVILSPGSRCAPLTLAFVRHPAIKVRTITDERAAAFIGLGISLTTRKPVVLVCTSGTAALNYAPAVAEAFYQQVPLLILTADRPPEWIDQLDGQTIRQENLYNLHAKRSFSFPLDPQHSDSFWFSERILSEAFLEALAFPPGPVQINVPLREPFYPKPEEKIAFSENIKIIQETTSAYDLNSTQLAGLQQEIKKFSRILIIAGQQQPSADLAVAVQTFARHTGAVWVADIISNFHSVSEVIRHQDVFLQGKSTESGPELQPDLLITFGLSNISKNLKLFIRAFPPTEHWHLQQAGRIADPFQSLTRVIRSTPFSFFSGLSGGEAKGDFHYQDQWFRNEILSRQYLQEFLAPGLFNEFTAFAYLLKSLPENSFLHVANSMAVRYANLIGLKPNQKVQVFANRGTSGIDGCTSTTVGSALSTEKITTLITGDLAFFYDRNGLWHNYLPQNLRIILLNNHAGGIFRLIDGPRQQPELAEYFETYQPLTACQTAQEFNLTYYNCRNFIELESSLPAFWNGGAAILEIETSSEQNATFFQLFKNKSPFKYK